MFIEQNPSIEKRIKFLKNEEVKAPAAESDEEAGDDTKKTKKKKGVKIKKKKTEKQESKGDAIPFVYPIERYFLS
jgi:hypothetical protein